MKTLILLVSLFLITALTAQVDTVKIVDIAQCLCIKPHYGITVSKGDSSYHLWILRYWDKGSELMLRNAGKWNEFLDNRIKKGTVFYILQNTWMFNDKYVFKIYNK